MMRLFLIIVATTPLLGTAPHQQVVLATSAVGTRVGARSHWFRTAVQPLFYAEWWGVIAVRCRIRTSNWLSAVEASIDFQAVNAARMIWPGAASNQIDENLQAFMQDQAKFRYRAWHAKQLECGDLLSSSEIDMLDQMAKNGGW